MILIRGKKVISYQADNFVCRLAPLLVLTFFKRFRRDSDQISFFFGLPSGEVDS